MENWGAGIRYARACCDVSHIHRNLGTEFAALLGLARVEGKGAHRCFTLLRPASLSPQGGAAREKGGEEHPCASRLSTKWLAVANRW
jgi:hypothetical protein